ncbi:MAG: Hsp20/alpha crystallin family protein [Planctomycetes bacterium]|nr:Hsp20/alpha crystallin family protein [Planctomycetota bacterium]
MTTSTCCENQGHKSGSCKTSSAKVTYRPVIDVVETADAYRVIAEIPGVGPENLEVQFERGELTIFGQVASAERSAEPWRKEFVRGDFRRVLAIQDEIDADGIVAELKFGVLNVLLPKAKAVRPRKIQIRVG